MNTDKIRKLYEEGKSIREIAKMLDVTEWTVRKATKGVQKGEKEVTTPSQLAARIILPLSIRPEGVSGKEIYPILLSAFGYTENEDTGYKKLNATQEQKTYVKRLVRDMAKKEEKEALFTKDWMSKQDPYGSLDMICKCANSLNQALQEEVDYFLEHYPECEGFDLRREIVYLALDGISQEPVIRRCDRNQQTISKLAQRLGISRTENMV